MSEIPYIPVDTYIPDLTCDDNLHYRGTGQLVVPFTMLDISKEQHFSYLKGNQHAFCSWLPLYDNCYWLMIVKSSLLQDKSTLDQSQLYYQNDLLAQSGPFEFYFSRVRKPFQMHKVKMTLTDSPFTYASRQARTGKIPHVNLIDLRDQTTLINSDDSINNFMGTTQTDNLIRLNYAQMLGGDKIGGH